jgi:hypothetical protein
MCACPEPQAQTEHPGAILYGLGPQPLVLRHSSAPKGQTAEEWGFSRFVARSLGQTPLEGGYRATIHRPANDQGSLIIVRRNPLSATALPSYPFESFVVKNRGFLLDGPLRPVYDIKTT